ncbi:hypothetical protein KC644_02440 [Candidatus Berkelbacteria bacterium]|nr:hypothetical protein [Candidatus Berkelbacteria bacterium]
MILTLLDLVRKKPLKNAPGEHVFWLHDGHSISNLRELRDAFKLMTNRQFSHHVTAERNDFVNWITDILEDSVLADDLALVQTQREAYEVVSKHLADWYELSHA